MTGERGGRWVVLLSKVAAVLGLVFVLPIVLWLAVVALGLTAISIVSGLLCGGSLKLVLRSAVTCGLVADNKTSCN